MGEFTVIRTLAFDLLAADILKKEQRIAEIMGRIQGLLGRKA